MTGMGGFYLIMSILTAIIGIWAFKESNDFSDLFIGVISIFFSLTCASGVGIEIGLNRGNDELVSYLIKNKIAKYFSFGLAGGLAGVKNILLFGQITGFQRKRKLSDRLKNWAPETSHIANEYWSNWVDLINDYP
jgi:hypothetical protein